MFDPERLDAMVAEGWLRSQRHPEADLWIYNYTEKTQFEKHWTPETLACRGLILDADGAVVARPFPKFFNLHELRNFNPAEHGSYRVTEKIDGSLGIVYWIDGEREPRIATRGSFTSEQAIEGTRMIQGRELEEEPDYTPLFEIVYPENRIVVDYGDRRELVFLDAIDKATGLGGFDFPSWIWNRAEVYEGLTLEALAAEERPNCEGYVVSFDSGTRIKVKHAEYVRLHRIVTGVNARSIWDALRNLLRAVPAAVRFISAEPLLGPLIAPTGGLLHPGRGWEWPDGHIGWDLDLTGIDWIITGGESGPDHRPFDPQWALDLRDEAASLGIAFFHKQNGGPRPDSNGRLLDGRTYDEMPPLATREAA